MALWDFVTIYGKNRNGAEAALLAARRRRVRKYKTVLNATGGGRANRMAGWASCVVECFFSLDLQTAATQPRRHLTPNGPPASMAGGASTKGFQRRDVRPIAGSPRPWPRP
jgi:hypothetical protein